MMSESDDKPHPGHKQSVVKFPQSRILPKMSKPESRDLDISKLTQ